MSYDANGNILSLRRNSYDDKDKKTVNIDDLVYGYSGNQLKKVEDAGSSSGFKNGASVDAEYLYDANGNMTCDLNKGIKDIKYNELNLPDSISFVDGRKISYIYSAAGEKLQNIVGGKTISYCGSFVYEDKKLAYILNSEGRYVVNGSDGVYEYNICDHLGNVRAVVDAAGTVKQQSNYYPFGGVFAQTGSPDNKYLYNGKEKQEGTDWLDYGARMYSADLGRFMTVDRFAVKYSNITPYHYCANDPIKHIDVNGDSIRIQYKNDRMLYEKGKLYNNDGSIYSGKIKGFLKKTINALTEIISVDEGAKLVSELETSQNNFIIKRGLSNSFSPNSNFKAGANLSSVQLATGNSLGSDGSSGIINWNPNTSLSGFNTSGNRQRPSFIGLAHELFHGRDSNQGLLHFSRDYTNIGTGVSYIANRHGLLKSEWRAVYFENVLRGQKGLPYRTCYGVQEISPGVFRPFGVSLLNSNNQPILR